ncbi:16887_t:CDS:2, partial [Acaulospora morrowiae]
ISVSMADVYPDPSLGCPTGSSQGNKNSKKRGVSSSSEANKQIKRRASKSSEKSFEVSPVSVTADESIIGLTPREDADKYPHKCSVVGCPKVYKNANGLKYHNEHGHVPQSSNGAREKPWPCRLPDCQKAYGSKGGLTYHVHHVHPNDLWALP